MAVNDSCCRAPPNCPEDVSKKVCAYYNDKTGPREQVRLGGIYDPRVSKHNSIVSQECWEGIEEAEQEEKNRRDEERRAQCQVAMKKWSFDFLKKIPHPLAPCSDSQAQIAKKRFKDMERVQSATENIVEKFGGLTLGFSGPLPPPQVIQYHGLKVIPRRYPEYPQELRMKSVYRPRIPNSSRRRRSWEEDDVAPNVQFPVQATFSPPTASTVPSTSQVRHRSITGAGEAGAPPNLLFIAGKAALQGKDKGAGAAGSSFRRRHVKCSTMPPSADELILEYVDTYNLEMMFEYFLAIACLYTPENPFQLISDLAGKMMQARSDNEEFLNLDRIFTPEHVSALFRLFDKEQNGHITHKQYKTGLETLGLVNYTKEPEGFDSDKIIETVFVDEAIRALDLLLKSFMVVNT